MKTNDNCASPPRILFVSPYRPRESDLATFTRHLREAISTLCENARAAVIALTEGNAVDYPPEVIFEIRQDRVIDYIVAAEYAKYSYTDVICVQHESDIFGGEEGRYITEFLNKSRKPVVTTLHTVLPDPSPGQRESLAQVVALSDHLVVPNSSAIPILKDDYGIPENKVSFIQQTDWLEAAREYLEVFARIATRPRMPAAPPIPDPSSVRFILEKIKLDHLIRLTDDTGLIRNATYEIPDRRSGYSCDDAARALVVTLMHFIIHDDKRALELASKYLSFLQQAQMPDGKFQNFMSYDRRLSDEGTNEDTFGRALWGLGAAVALAPDEGMRVLSRTMFERGLEALDLHHPRAIAYGVCGLSSFLRRYEGATAVRRKLVALTDYLAESFERSSDEGWRWFDEEMTCANAKLPHAMLLAYRATGIERFKNIGLESLDCLLDVTYHDGYFDFIGNRGWYRRGGERAVFSQQPIEAGYTAEACMAAYGVTRRQRFLDAAEAAAEWLLGRNQLYAKLYDFSTGACADALEPSGSSMKQGAEAAVCSMLALLSIKTLSRGLIESEMAVTPVEKSVATGTGVVTGEFVTIKTL